MSATTYGTCSRPRPAPAAPSCRSSGPVRRPRSPRPRRSWRRPAAASTTCSPRTSDPVPGTRTRAGEALNGELRIGDAERDAVAAALHEHYAQGRLDREELDERLSAALSAKTVGDLRQVTRDLPPSAG